MITVFRVLLVLTHFICDLLTAIHNCYATFHRWCIDIWYGENPRKEIELLVRSSARMKKLPRHVVVIFGAKDDTVFDCIRIIGWCVTLGIPYISFYDINGFLVRNESFLKCEIEKRRPELVELISWSKPTSKKNGITGSKQKARVSLLSPLNGKGEIITLTKKLAEAVVTGTIKSEEINTDLLNEKLNSRGIPDPEMGLIYGTVCCTYGVLPWHTRITEFYTLPLHYGLTVEDFACSLEKYSKCEQRYGK